MNDKTDKSVSPRCLLALDAAGASCSVAVWQAGRVLAEDQAAMARGQSERLVPMAQAVMQQAGLDWPALDAVAATNGPGGFTGVRIGLAAAQGLALAWDLPVVTVSCFEAYRAAVPADERRARWLLVLIEAKRAEVYVELTDPEGQCVLGPALMSEEELCDALPRVPLLLAGDAAPSRVEGLGAAGHAPVVSRAADRVSAGVLAALAAARTLPQRPYPAPQPLYLRQADTTQPGKRNRR